MSPAVNNFDALRFWAAVAVLWSHTVPVSQGSERNELLFRWSRGQTTTGTVAVFVFFALSGYLITRSFERAASPWQFVRARVLRIMPALIAVLAVTAFVVGPWITSLPLHAYFASPGPYRYLLVQGGLLFGWVDSLPGVFTDHPLTAVNGPLWTLRFEVECYVLVFLLGVSGLLRKELTLALYVLALAALAIFPGAPGTPELPPVPNQHLNLSAGFLAGALIHQWKLKLDGRVAAACGALTIACLFSGQMLLAQRTLIPYLALYLAIGPSMVRIPHPWSRSDVSYGLYIWAWPVTQLVVGFSDAPHWLTTGLIVMPVALALGWLSWNLVEKRALMLKSRTPFAPTSAVAAQAGARA